jgi:hypothetical protein
MARRKLSNAATQSSANIGFEAKLGLAADKLRNNMDAAEYKHVVLGLIFLKYISDAFEEVHAKMVAGKGQYEGSDPEDPDEYRAEHVFWVPKKATGTRPASGSARAMSPLSSASQGLGSDRSSRKPASAGPSCRRSPASVRKSAGSCARSPA